MSIEQKERTCEGCTLCCKLPKIEELNKPAYTWCKHCTPKANLGCGIHETRPNQCREFSCLWLLGRVPEEYKPSEVKFVMTMQKEENVDKMMIVIFIEDTNASTLRRKPFIRWIMGVMERKGFLVGAIINGVKYQLFISDDKKQFLWKRVNSYQDIKDDR